MGSGDALGEPIARRPPAASVALPAALVFAVALGVVAATLVLVGQPIYANDTWIHLALGEAFAARGPWLESDPHLFAAPGPPSPGSWLGSLALFETLELAGFVGLRLLHVAFVALVLALAWRVLRRAGADRPLASLGLVLFVVLSTYRLVQLRPHLFTMAALLAVHLLLIAPRRPPTRGAIGAAAILTLVWANVHAAFLLGPGLVIGSAAALALLPWLAAPLGDPGEASRARGLLFAGGWMLIASLANPQGPQAHLAWFLSGTETLDLAAVVDEWGRTDLFSWPHRRLPPTPAAWLVGWLCVLALALGGARLWKQLRDPDRVGPTKIDPALFAWAVLGLGAAIAASRFLWLGVFALALAASLLRAGAGLAARRPVGRAWATLAAITLAVVGHVELGDWPLVSKALFAPGASYAEPYRAEKFHAHAVWFLADSGVEGRIYNDYALGGFMSYWLAPKLRMASSGTMNVERSAMEANLAIAGRQPLVEGESYAELLDRQGIDLFLGVGLPIQPPPSRPVPSTLRFLEGEPGWIPVFRSLRSVVFLRRSSRNDRNLARIVDYYGRAGVPFDPAIGFDPERVIAEAPDWAIAHGLLPRDFAALQRAVRTSQQRSEITLAMRRLAIYYAVIGLYDRAERVDRFILGRSPADVGAAQRLIWCLLQQGREAEALAAARRFEQGPLGQAADFEWSRVVERILEAPPDEARALIQRMPLLGDAQAQLVQSGIVPPEARRPRPPPWE